MQAVHRANFGRPRSNGRGLAAAEKRVGGGPRASWRPTDFGRKHALANTPARHGADVVVSIRYQKLGLGVG